MADIVLDHITKRYPDGATAVSDVNVTIDDGEFIILVGPSGCGKSTTLNMIAGLEDITEGELRVGGQRVNEMAPRDRDIAMVFQSYALYPHMTVRENIAFPLTLQKLSKNEVARKVDEAATILDLKQHLDRRPSNLSGGQRQRVAMGRAIVRNPKAFLMDEPLSNLDAKLRVQMRTEISRIQNRLGTTTVYVTHDQTEAMTLGDRVVVLKGGDVQQIGAPQELYERPANLFVAGFIGSPSMNFVPGRITGEGVVTSLGTIAVPNLAAVTSKASDVKNREGHVLVGIRPEYFEDARLVDSALHERELALTVTADVLESLGSDKYVYFSSDRDGAENRRAASNLGVDPGIDASGQIVARISSDSAARKGQPVELVLDASKVTVFDEKSGANLSL